jgi:hypothetical protein
VLFVCGAAEAAHHSPLPVAPSTRPMAPIGRRAERPPISLITAPAGASLSPRRFAFAARMGAARMVRPCWPPVEESALAPIRPKVVRWLLHLQTPRPRWCGRYRYLKCPPVRCQRSCGHSRYGVGHHNQAAASARRDVPDAGVTDVDIGGMVDAWTLHCFDGDGRQRTRCRPTSGSIGSCGALQARRRLGVQALALANSHAHSVPQLFRSQESRG